MKKFEFKIHGAIKGGKNHINITRTGHRYPNRKWAEWRDQVVREIREELKNKEKDMITTPCQMQVIYTPNDAKRRDMPAMIDAIFHCLERAGLVKDDYLIQRLRWYQMPKDVKNSGTSIEIEEI